MKTIIQNKKNTFLVSFKSKKRKIWIIKNINNFIIKTNEKEDLSLNLDKTLYGN